MQIQFEYLWRWPSLLSRPLSYANMRYLELLLLRYDTGPITPSLQYLLMVAFVFIVQSSSFYPFNILILFVCTECVQQSVYSVQGIYILDDQSLV